MNSAKPGNTGESNRALPFHTTYDSLNRLKSAEEKDAANVTSWKQTYNFDRYGNRTFDQSNTSFPASFTNTNISNPTIDAANNKFTTGQGYTYDLSGNLLTDAEGRSFTYDAENKQKTASNSGGTLGQYYYDGDGKRVKKITNSETVIFIYDAGGKLVEEYSTQLSMTPQVQYLTNDNLGTPRINTNKNGTIVSRSDYMPYGEEITGLGGRSSTDKYVVDDIRQGFTGYIKDDETDLDFAQARMYKRELGRFTGADPIHSSAEIEIPQTWNRYNYTLNNPLKFTDPTGMFVWSTELGGDADDDHLEEYFTKRANRIKNDNKRAKALKNIAKMVTFAKTKRDEIRAAIKEAQSKLNSLDGKKHDAVQRSLDAYGCELNCNQNVVLGTSNNKNGSAVFADNNGMIFVFLGKGLSTEELAIEFAHEGSHVADMDAFNHGGEDMTSLQTERTAWRVSAYMAEAFDLESYPSTLPGKFRVWKRGWEEKDSMEAISKLLANPKIGYQQSNDRPGLRFSEKKQMNLNYYPTYQPQYY